MRQRKMITVDLSKEKIDVMPMRDDLTRDYIGGEGTGTRLLWEMLKPHTDALAPGNTIVFATGPLNGTIFPAGPRGTVVFKSPETGTVSMSNIGGHWTARLKFAGYDLIAVTGKAKRPVYLFIDDETVELRDAEHIWGTTIPRMEEELKKEIGG
ncbi:MAG: aldehyde ferredoxin oxidoreductase, partial [Methanosarcinaceae archaeon]|nr:aldehyde ferredoxin oxidoreductase [Methanosarcinaceae archaeon]